MIKKRSILLIWLVAILALTAMTLLLTRPSWSSPAGLFVTTVVPALLPTTTGAKIVLNGGGFSQKTTLWLVPERSLRSATTATLETYGFPQHFAHRGDHLYVANGTGGISIVQGLQSPNPTISGVLARGGQGMEIVLNADKAIMAAGSSGLQIIDIRDDANPQLLSVLRSVAPALSVASAGKIAYVATGKNGVQIVDLTDPRQPQQLGQLPNLPMAYKVFCDEEILIVATGSGGWVYDIRTPEKPRRLAQLPVGGRINTVMTRYDGILYWSTKTLQENRLYAIDLRQPEAPRVLTSVPLNGTPSGISCNEEHVAIALGSSGTQIFSRVGHARLTPYQTMAAKNRTRFVLPLGSDLWVGDGGGELLRLDPQKATALTTSSLLPDYSPRIPLLVTPQLFLLGDVKGLAIYARGDDPAPTLRARLPITGLVQQYLTANREQLWLAIRNAAPLTTGKLICVDFSTPHAPRVTAEIPLPHVPTIVGESGMTLIVSTETPTEGLTSGQPLVRVDATDVLYFIDMSLLASPALISAYPLAKASAGIAITDQFLLLMQQDGLFRLLDLTEVPLPNELGSLQIPWLQTSAWSGAVNIAVKDKVAFISSRLGKIVAIDLHDPRQPKNLGTFSFPGPVSSLASSEDFLLALIEKVGMAVIDVRNPLLPEILGTIPLPGILHNGTVQGEKFWYVMPATNGIHFIPLPRRLSSAVTGTNQLSARFEQPPPPGAYRFWLTDQQNHLLLPGVTWLGSQQ